VNLITPIPVAARCKAWVYGSSLAGIAGFESSRENGCVSLMSVVCVVQRSPTECGVSELDQVQQ
jgi:hypothetical protein